MSYNIYCVNSIPSIGYADKIDLNFFSFLPYRGVLNDVLLVPSGKKNSVSAIRKMSKRTKQRIYNSVAWLIDNKKDKIPLFLTYTIPPQSPDCMCPINFESHSFYREQFKEHIKQLKNDYGLTNYLYVCELQERRTGKPIHFHLIGLFDTRIDFENAQSQWCRKIKRPYSNNCIDAVEIGKPFNDKSGKRRHIKSPNGLKRYMCKYVSKNTSFINTTYWGADRETQKKSKPTRLNSHNYPDLEKLILQNGRSVESENIPDETIIYTYICDLKNAVGNLQFQKTLQPIDYDSETLINLLDKQLTDEQKYHELVKHKYKFI